YNRLDKIEIATDVFEVYCYDNEGNLGVKFEWRDAVAVGGDGDGLYDYNEQTQFVFYNWDHRNRLVAVNNYDTLATPVTLTVEYAYDYLNRLVARTADLDGAGTQHGAETEYFVYDGGSPGSAEQPDKEVDPGQIVLRLDENGAPTHRHLWGPAVDQILADEFVDDGGTEDVLWPLTDHQNTVRDQVGYNQYTSSTYLVNHIEYDAYGNKLSETNAVDHLFAYTGRMFDEATGLQDNLNRWYDPEVGRWMSEDPIGFMGGDENLYRYVGNEPGNGFDQSGLEESGGYRGGWWNPANWLRGIYTGDPNAPDSIYEGATGAGGKSYSSNPAREGLRHGANVDPTGLADAVDSVLSGLEEGENPLKIAGNAGLSLLPGPNPNKAKKGAKLAIEATEEAADAVKRKSSKTIRKEWEKVNKKKWPKDKKAGRNQDVSHKKALADGGTNDLNNIEPRPHDEHMREHKEAGDFKRWGARANKKPKTP
ncbi:MAG: RHS repeat-associated core domain-containing protein, partial [Planctomycetota bacterium]|nr:RHS repeat-associated core domain-containing protein [Planctomycetota bacterium]